MLLNFLDYSGATWHWWISNIQLNPSSLKDCNAKIFHGTSPIRLNCCIVWTCCKRLHNAYIVTEVHLPMSSWKISCLNVAVLPLHAMKSSYTLQCNPKTATCICTCKRKLDSSCHLYFFVIKNYSNMDRLCYSLKRHT